VNFILKYSDYLERILVGTQAVNGLKGTGPVQINGLWGAIACVKQTGAKVNSLVIQSSSSGMKRVRMNTSKSEEFFTGDHLRKLQSIFEYEPGIEFSGFASLETDVLQFEKHIGPSSPFPWGPRVVFHTHFRTAGAELFSITDLFLFACAPAFFSLLFSEFQVSVLEKRKPESKFFSFFRKKLDALRKGGHLRRNSGMNSCYFSSILERKFPELKSIISHEQRIDFICKTMDFKLTEHKL